MAGRPGSVLTKLALRKAVGLYVGDHELTVCHVAFTPAGPVELSNRTEPYEPERLVEAVERVLKPLAPAKRGLRASVAVGLPALRVFFASRPVGVSSRDTAPNVLLHELFRSSNVNVEEMEVDLIRGQPGKAPVASLVSCRRKYLAGVVSALGKCGVRPHRAEPAPFALLRLAAQRHRAPRKAKGVIRVFLGASQGVAVLAAGDLPLAWRMFELPAGAEAAAAAVRSAAKALQLVGRYRGDLPAPDALIVHGRPDLDGAFKADEPRGGSELPAEHVPGPGYDPGSVALGLALGCQSGEQGFDLSRALKPRAPLWEVIPFGEIALQTALLMCVTLYLSHQDAGARRAYRLVRAEAAKHPWMAKVNDDKLDKEKKELEQKVEAVREYLDTRILWTAYTRDTTSRLPESIMLRSFAGQCELAMGPKRGKPKKSFLLKLAAPIGQGRAMPREIDDYLNALRRDALLQRDFPVVELADLKWSQPLSGKASALADFTVMCLPAADKPVVNKDKDKDKDKPKAAEK